MNQNKVEYNPPITPEKISRQAYRLYKILATLCPLVLLAINLAALFIPSDSEAWGWGLISFIGFWWGMGILLAISAFLLTIVRQFRGIEMRLLLLMLLTMLFPGSVLFDFFILNASLVDTQYMVSGILLVYGVSVWLIAWKR